MGRNRWNLNKGQRMQLKAMICCLGLLLLVILFLGQLFLGVPDGEKEPEEEVHIPVIEQLSNVWVMEASDSGVLIYQDGAERSYGFGETWVPVPGEALREQIADVVLTDGAVTQVLPKTQKINGKILSADDNFVEVEGFGKLPLASDYRGYRIYKELAMCTSRNLAIGYDFADLVIENGEICGILMVKEEAMEYIRVLVKAFDYARLLHEQVTLTADCDYTVTYGPHDGPVSEMHTAGEELVIGGDSGYFTGERITITPNVLTGKIQLNSVKRSQGLPEYRGQMELIKTDEGIAVVNQVLLEEYLYCVVPSEMPASYPEEALKAQAICARTYAYGHMLQAGYPQYGAHVDDSTSYQVYNNILEQESTTTAVKETYGQLLYTASGALAGTYYYSTSCGVGSDANVWKTEEAKSIDYLTAKPINAKAQNELGQNGVPLQMDVPVGADDLAVQTDASVQGTFAEQLQNEEIFASFITSKNIDDFEVTEGWYRWSYQVKQIDVERMCGILQKRYEVNPKLVLTLEDGEYVSKPIEEFKEIQDLYISKRGVGGIADELILVTEEGTYQIITEHNIRYLLNNGESKVVRQDGSQVASPSLLPSAFFVIDVSRQKDEVVGYTLHGGGFGHGVGMSQNAAKHMAKAGYTSGDILLFFYDNCSIVNIYE